jgi:hypothetical protein
MVRRVPTLLTLLMLVADPVVQPANQPPPDPVGVRTVALIGLITAFVAGGLTAAIPFADKQDPGRSDAALLLAASAFWMVAVVRPFVFFGGQSLKPAKSGLADVLRVIGTLGAVGGLASFIAYGVLRANHSSNATWALIPTAGLEALSAAAFGLDALIAANSYVVPTVSAVPTRDGMTVMGGLTARF